MATGAFKGRRLMADKTGDSRLYAVATAVFAGCAGVTLYFCHSMSGGMEMSGGWTMSMMWMRMPGQSWAGAAAMFMGMWVAMMVAMMLPSAVPMLQRHRGTWGMTGLVAAGYFFVWSAAGAGVYLPGVVLGMAAMRWDAVSRAVPYLTAAAVLGAGVLQFTPWKWRALSRCRGPFSCTNGGMMREWDAWKRGVQCGVRCVTCCFGPTLILLALGMMNPVVIGIITVLIAMEKLLPEPKYVVRGAGVLAVIWGVGMLV